MNTQKNQGDDSDMLKGRKKNSHTQLPPAQKRATQEMNGKYEKIGKLRETFGGTSYRSATVLKKSVQQ